MEGAEKVGAKVGEMLKGGEPLGYEAARPENGARDFGAEQAKREAAFCELPIEGKVMRLRDAMQALAVVLEGASREAREANDLARYHDHGAGGMVLVPYRAANALSRGEDSAQALFRRIHRALA